MGKDESFSSSLIGSVLDHGCCGPSSHCSQPFGTFRNGVTVAALIVAGWLCATTFLDSIKTQLSEMLSTVVQGSSISLGTMAVISSLRISSFVSVDDGDDEDVVPCCRSAARGGSCPG
jgi:hypothetical protein